MTIMIHSRYVLERPQYAVTLLIYIRNHETPRLPVDHRASLLLAACVTIIDKLGQRNGSDEAESLPGTCDATTMNLQLPGDCRLCPCRLGGARRREYRVAA